MLPVYVMVCAAAVSQSPGILIHPPAAVAPAHGPAATPVGDALYECPTKSDPAPFLRIPSQELIAPCREDAVGRHAHGKAASWSYVFHRPARVMPPRYGQHQQPLEGEGLLIYEGMTLRVDEETGVYDLSFLATSPPRPVLLRLQLQFVRPFGGAEPVRLTLPPIALDGDDDLTRPGVTPGTTVRINHRGYTELFKIRAAQSTSLYSDLTAGSLCVDANFPIHPRDWKIIRVGTARFGAGLANADDLSR